MKNKFRKMIACALAVVMACQFQVPTWAASENKQYVSDVIISYGEGDSAESDAKQWLTDNGYEIVDTNLNAGAESGASASYISWATGARSARAVYLGYKTTTDSSQAITSLKTMNMSGSYSFDSYQEVLDQMADQISGFMDKLKVTLAEWRENYKAGRGRALQTYYILNLMYSPDNNNMKMGDLLLNETKEELGDDAYNKLSDEEKLLHADMTTILMQGNSDATKYIEQLVAMGADTDTEKTWLTRLCEMGSYDDMMDALEAEAEEKGETFLPSEAAATLSSKYDDAAMILATSITELQKLFKEYLDSGVTLKSDEADITKYIENSDSILDVGNKLNIGALYEALAAFKYPSPDNPDRTLQDFFMQEFTDSDADSRTELYPMAAALSDGQREAIDFVSLAELISQGILTEDEAAESANTAKECAEGSEPVSVFTGVDRSIYDSSSTALTSSARELQNSSQKSYTEGVFGSPFSLRSTILAAAFATTLIASLGCLAVSSAYFSESGPSLVLGSFMQEMARRHAAERAGIVAEGGRAAFQEFIEEEVRTVLTQAHNGDVEALQAIAGYEGALEWYEHNQTYLHKWLLYKGFKIASGVLAIVTVALGVWTVISGIQDLKAYYNRDMDLYPIPDNMVDESTDDSGAFVYTYYKAVQSNRVEKGYTADREALKDNADLNGDLGKEWLALYYTKDKSAGSPIMVSDISGFTVIKGSDSTPSGMTALTLFDQDNPVNLTNEDWVWNDTTNGLYLYYTVDNNASHAASIFTDSNAWILYAAGGIIIAIVFCMGGMHVGKRRRLAGEKKVAN